MLRGKVKEATRWITQRMTDNVLTPTEVDSNSGKTVFEVLKEKHPMPGTVDPIAFIDSNTFPCGKKSRFYRDFSQYWRLIAGLNRTSLADSSDK